jgi:hypothetical protein
MPPLPRSRQFPLTGPVGVLSGAVPVDEIAYGLGIGEIRRE